MIFWSLHDDNGADHDASVDHSRGARCDGRLVAGLQLPDHRADLPQGQRVAARPLADDDIKPRLLGHWGTSPGLSFIYAHVSRLITPHRAAGIYLAGPGHGGPALVAASWLEGTYSEIYPAITRDGDGMHRLFRQFSSPGGIPSHVSVTTPGSIHEGGELGYVLVHAFGVGDGQPRPAGDRRGRRRRGRDRPARRILEGHLLPQPGTDGAVLPILHLNGAKIAGPTVLGRKPPRGAQRCSRATATR